MPSAIKGIRSPSHTLVLEKKSTSNWIAELGEGSTALDKDLIIDISQEQPYGSRAIIERFTDAEGKSGWGAKSMALQATL
jgi:hypothetical protein